MSAMTATRSTVRTERPRVDAGHTSDATAAATRKTAGAGTGTVVAQLRREDRERERARDDQDDDGEVGELGHGNTAPTRLPGSPRAKLPAAKAQPSTNPGAAGHARAGTLGARC